MKLHWTADGAEQSRTLAGDEVRIGRGSNNEIVLRDFSVSRSHATIRLNADGTWTIEDLGRGIQAEYIEVLVSRKAGLPDLTGDVRPARKGLFGKLFG